MEQATVFWRPDEPETLENTLRQMFCPACGAFMMRLGGFARCPRCRYNTCDSCDGGCDGETP
jgi:hypothetical protein